METEIKNYNLNKKGLLLTIKRNFFALTLAVTLSLTACSNPDNGINITVEPSDSSHGETISYTEEAPPTFSTEPVTFDGYSLTPEGDSVPVRLTIAIENVQEGIWVLMVELVLNLLQNCFVNSSMLSRV